MNNEKRRITRGDHVDPPRTFGRFLSCGAFAFALLASTPATAAGYAGLRGGASDGNHDIGDSGGFAELFGGYRLDERWSIEAGYLEREGSPFAAVFFLNPAQPPTPIDVDSDARVRALTLTARAQWPVSRRGILYVRAGGTFNRVDQELEFQDPIFSQPRRTNVDGQGAGWLVAVGFDLLLSKRWRLGLDLQHLGGDYEVGCTSQSGAYDCAFNRQGSLQLAGLSLAAEF